MRTPSSVLPSKGLSRRQAMTIAGAGGVGVVATLPKKWSAPIVDAIVLPVHAQASGAPIVPFASATLGQTGQGGGYVLSVSQFLGVRFVLAAPGVTSTIGIHASGSGTIFAAIVALSSLADFPDSSDLSTPDVVGSAVMALPATSAEIQAPLVRNLPAGTYALIYGSGVLGASGNGSAPSGNPDIGVPSYFFQSGGVGGTYTNGGFNQVRMFLS